MTDIYMQVKDTTVEQKESFFDGSEVTLTGIVQAIGREGFIEKAFAKAEILDNLLYDDSLKDKYEELCNDLGYSHLLKDTSC